MIRFSAVLVAVAIAVLIGGIAASELLLVYIAIAVSAVALVALAIGVALKREELFGEGQGEASARVGADQVPPARIADSDYQSRPNGHVTPPPPQGAAGGPGAAFAGYAQPQATRPEAAQPAGAWETGAGRGSWPAPVTAATFPGAGQAPPSAGAPTLDWGVQDVAAPPVPDGPAVPGSGTDSAARIAPAPSVSEPQPADPSAASATAPGIGRSSWFSPQDPAVNGGEPATRPRPAWSRPNAATPVPGLPGSKELTGSRELPEGDKELPEGKEQEGGGETAESVAAGGETGWSTRNSWLNDEPGTDEPGVPEDDGETSDGNTAEHEAPAPPTAPPAAGDHGEDAGADRAGSSSDGEPVSRHAVREPLAAAEETEAADAAESRQAPGDGLVTVIPGVPRFHQPDCVLIRFMPDDDTRKMEVAQAKEAGCTPCAACHPEA